MQVPIGEKLTPQQWTGRTMRLFAATGLYTPTRTTTTTPDPEQDEGSEAVDSGFWDQEPMLEGDDEEGGGVCPETGRVVPIMHREENRPMQCTNQSIRRSAAQWAGRCGANIIDVKNTGRWASMSMLAKYIGHGVDWRARLEEGGATDPICATWVYKRSTTAGEGGQSAF